MQLCIKKVETKAVMTVRMKLPIFSALGTLKSFINLEFYKLNNNFLVRRNSQPPQPLLTVMRGFDLYPKPLCPLQGRGLNSGLQKPPNPPVFWYRGTRDEFLMATPWRGRVVEKLQSLLCRRLAIASFATRFGGFLGLDVHGVVVGLLEDDIL